LYIKYTNYFIELNYYEFIRKQPLIVIVDVSAMAVVVPKKATAVAETSTITIKGCFLMNS